MPFGWVLTRLYSREQEFSSGDDRGICFSRSDRSIPAVFEGLASPDFTLLVEGVKCPLVESSLVPSGGGVGRKKESSE